MHAISNSAVERLLEDLADELAGVLGDQLIGLYLYGSYVVGGFDDRLSDLDVLAATAADVDDVTLERLRTLHVDIVDRHPEWADRVEVAYLSREGLQSFRHRRTSMAIISPGERLHFRTAGVDWLMNWYLVRERGRTLVGPPPTELISSIPIDEFVESLREHARWRTLSIGDVRGLPGQSYAVLTMCRTLCAHLTGELAPKADAAAWVAATFPEWSGLLQDALAWRAAASEHSDDDSPPRPEVVAFVQTVANIVSERRSPSRDMRG